VVILGFQENINGNGKVDYDVEETNNQDQSS
jgi:hypothetical protein